MSPNKTYEGLAGGMLVAVLAAVVICGRFVPWDDLGDSIKLGVVVAIAAPLGDLCESMIKRDLGIKDMGTILPGHGGVLDRFDALLFVPPRHLLPRARRYDLLTRLTRWRGGRLERPRSAGTKTGGGR